ncbi:RSM10 [Candida pseudojiufengensis]|uniref:RSM10 n=1 Tax=Candida pseudojiufengensis TaxID=497109 RepID=UPI0022252814|nr:RSM10 [Candida pseudojiufengensis]KAI5965157.1 RSM10 [Candida pseudojiufengensis]
MIQRRLQFIRKFNSRTCLNQKFISPNELINQQQQKRIEQEQFQKNLQSNQITYKPKILSSHKLASEGEKRPIPINVELLQYKPLRLPQTHGNEVATINFRGYNEDEIIRMGEFALRSGYYLGIPLSPLTSQKTEKRLYTVIKSPFAQAKTKQNFHRITYNKQIVAYDSNPEVIDLWLSYINKYKLSTVEMNCSIITNEKLNYVDDLLKTEDFDLPKAYEDLEDPVALKVKELLQSKDFKKHL